MFSQVCARHSTGDIQDDFKGVILVVLTFIRDITSLSEFDFFFCRSLLKIRIKQNGNKTVNKSILNTEIWHSIYTS